MLSKLVDMQYERNDTDPARSKFRVRGDSVEIWPSYEEFAYRIEFWGDEIEKLSIINPTSGEVIDNLEQVFIYPAKHFVLPEERIERAVDEIRKELSGRLEIFRQQGKMLEAQRLNARTRYDLEMMLEMGYCPGIENYSRPLSGRAPASHPTRCSTSFRTTTCCSSTNRMPPCRKSARCIAATAAARKRWSSTASDCRARWTIGR